MTVDVPAVSSITCRRLAANDWQAFRMIRLDALLNDPHMFGLKYDDEKCEPASYWQDWITGAGNAIFVAFHDDHPIAVTSAVKWRKDIIDIKPLSDDPRLASMSVFCNASYVQPPYRRLGLFKALHRERLMWAGRQEHYRYAFVAFRQSNLKVQSIHRAFGFEDYDTHPFLWPDGVTDNVVIQKLDLQKNFRPL